MTEPQATSLAIVVVVWAVVWILKRHFGKPDDRTPSQKLADRARNAYLYPPGGPSSGQGRYRK